MRLRSLGDLVLLTPALAAVHNWRPDLRLCVLVEPALAALLEGNPNVSEILRMGKFAATARQLRRRRFPVVYNQHAGPSSALLVAATRVPKRVCWRGRQFSFVYNILVDDPSGKIHTAEHRMEQFYGTGLPRGPIPPAQVFPQADALRSVAARLAAFGIGQGSAYAVIRPGARFFTKRWAVPNFIAVARWLREECGISPVFNLGQGEVEIASEVRRQCGAEFPLLDDLNLRELIAFIAGCRLFIGNDNGPTHLAAATGRPVVAIFSSSNSAHWRPWQTPHRVVQNDFACNPCRGDRCYAFQEPRCILSIGIDQVREACAALLVETCATRAAGGAAPLPPARSA